MNKERISITLSPEIIKKMKAKAEAENRSVSNYIETLLAKDLKK